MHWLGQSWQSFDQFDSEKQFQVCLKAGLSHWVVTWTYYFENDIPVRKDEKISHNGEVRSIAIGKDSKDYRDAFFLKDVALKEDNGATISSWFRKGVYFVDRCRLEQKSSTKSSEGS